MDKLLANSLFLKKRSRTDELIGHSHSRRMVRVGEYFTIDKELFIKKYPNYFFPSIVSARIFYAQDHLRVLYGSVYRMDVLSVIICPFPGRVRSIQYKIPIELTTPITDPHEAAKIAREMSWFTNTEGIKMVGHPRTPLFKELITNHLDFLKSKSKVKPKNEYF